MLLGPTPQIFIEVLRQCGALKALFPEIDALFGVPAPAKWHPEIDTGIHTLMVLEQACRISPELTVRFAALCHDLGKGVTPKEFWPSHHGHGQKGLPLIRALCERFRVPNECRDLALLVSDLHTHIHIAFELKPATLLKVFDKADAWRRPSALPSCWMPVAPTSMAVPVSRSGSTPSRTMWPKRWLPPRRCR